MFLDTEKLEKLLVANWTEVLDYRQLLFFANNQISIKDDFIKHLSVSRFEPVYDGFILWLEFTTKKGVNGTIEAL